MDCHGKAATFYRRRFVPGTKPDPGAATINRVGHTGRYDARMRRAEVIALLSASRDEIVRRFGVRSLSLFGSVARDEARPDSDVDVLVEFEGPTTFDGHMGLLIFLEDLLGRRVDVITAKGLKPRLRPLIDRDLVRVA